MKKISIVAILLVFVLSCDNGSIATLGDIEITSSGVSVMAEQLESTTDDMVISSNYTDFVLTSSNTDVILVSGNTIDILKSPSKVYEIVEITATGSNGSTDSINVEVMQRDHDHRLIGNWASNDGNNYYVNFYDNGTREWSYPNSLWVFLGGSSSSEGIPRAWNTTRFNRDPSIETYVDLTDAEIDSIDLTHEAESSGAYIDNYGCWMVYTVIGDTLTLSERYGTTNPYGIYDSTTMTFARQ